MISGNITDSGIKTRAAIWAAGVHLILLLILLLVRYTLPQPEPYTELGIEVNLGTDWDGSGTDQPLAINDPAEAMPKYQHQTRSSGSDNQLPDMIRSEDADAPEIGPANKHSSNQPKNSADQKSKNNKQEQSNSNKQQTRESPRYVYSGGSGTGGNRAAENIPGSSEGNTTGTGDRGAPGGTPGADNYEGSPGSGSGGISHSLTGRSISPNRFEAEFREGGRVVVQVTVDREGNITNATVISAPNAELRKIALQKIKQAKFSKTSGGEPQAFGEVTIIFKARS